jgi:hypothetical protein
LHLRRKLNTTRPEAKLKALVLKIASTNFQRNFYCARAVETRYPRVTIVPTIRTIFSLTRLVVVDT